MIDSAPLIILRRASGVYLPGTYFPFSFALFPNSGFPFSRQSTSTLGVQTAVLLVKTLAVRCASLPPAAARNIGEEGFRNMINNRVHIAGTRHGGFQRNLLLE